MMKYWRASGIIFGVINVVVFLIGCENQAEPILVSPDHKLTVQLFNTKSKLQFSFMHDTDTILSSSSIGLELGEIDLTKNVHIGEVAYKSYDNFEICHG